MRWSGRGRVTAQSNNNGGRGNAMVLGTSGDEYNKYIAEFRPHRSAVPTSTLIT